MIKNKILITVIVLFLILGINILLLGFSVYKNHFDERVTGNPDSEFRIGIFGITSEFKKKIAQGIIENYKKNTKIKFNSLYKLISINENEYNAIIIFDELYAGMALDMIIKSAISNINDKEKIVLFISTNPVDKFEFSHMGVDAITSSSKIDKQKEVLRKIISEVEKVRE